MASRVLWLVMCCSAVVALLTCSGCKDGGTWLLSTDDEIKLGTDAAAEFEKQHRVATGTADARLVQSLGASIARVASPPNYPYDFRVIDENTVNALAFPGGRIYMYRGLLDKLGRDRDMVAWVMAHEVSHVALRHSAKQIEKSMGAAVLTQVLLGKQSSGQIAEAVAGLMITGYGRDKELQSDSQGTTYAQKAGFDPTAGIGVVKVFQSLHGGKEPSNLELLFMTHPGDQTRINQIKAVCARRGYSGKYYP